MPLRTRLLISSLLGTVPLFLLGIILLTNLYLTRRQLILESNALQAELAATSISRWTRGHVNTLRTLAQSGEVQQGIRAEIRGLVDRQLRAQPEWDDLFVTNATGQVIASGYPRVSMAESATFRVMRRTLQPAVSNLFTSPITRRPAVVITVPILRNDRFDGGVGAVIESDQIHALFPSGVGRVGGHIELWGGDRRLIAQSGHITATVNRAVVTAYFARILTGRTGTAVITSPFTGQIELIGFAPVPSTPWTVATGTPSILALQPVYRSLAIFLALTIVVLAVTLFWSLYSAGLFARQVQALVDGARAIGEGNFASRVTLRTGSELDDLAASLNTMAASLAQLDQLRSDLITMVSHELKTPLTAILTSLDLTGSGAIAPGDPQFGELLGIAERQARRLQDMIENLIVVARLQAGTMVVETRPVVLSPLIRDAMIQLTPMMRDKGLTFTEEIQDNLRVLADPPRIRLALKNLLENAIKFTEHGSITVRAYRDDGQAVIEVVDTGIGIAAELLPRLFQRFSQLEPLLTRRAGGFGLGLWVVRSIVESHGGHAFARSDGPGHGSTFGFTLPLAKPEEP